MPNMTNSTMVVLAVVAVIAVLAIAWLLIQQRRRRTHLRERFGPEYDRTVRTVGTTGRAETVLQEREKRVSAYRIHELNHEERRRFSESWTQIQAKFVDDPPATVAQADRLVNEVMTARGYPMADFDRRAEDLTVEHPNVVNHYRAAHEIALNQSRQAASTEDLRQALVHYRELFADLLGERPVRRTA